MTPDTQLVPASQVEALQKELAVVKARDMVKLGDGAAFWIEEAGQQKRGFKAKVVLSEPEHMAFIQDKPMICAAGYDKANQYAGVEIVRPKTVIIEGGKEVGNPYFEKDSNGALVSMFIRGIGIGYAPTGSLAIVDQTVFVNLNTLLIQEIQGKLKYNPAIATLGIAGQRPDEFVAFETTYDREQRKRVISRETTIKTKGAWHFLPVYGTMGYWVNLGHPDVQSAFEGYVQKQRFLERSSTTVLRRLILAAHPAIATKTPTITRREKGCSQGFIYVYGFRAEGGDAKKKRDEMETLANKLTAGEAAADMQVIRQDAADITEEAEVIDPIGVADPSEIPDDAPPPGFENEDEPAVIETTPEEPDPNAPAALTANPLEELTKMLADAAKDEPLKQAVASVRKEMNISFSGLRAAKPEIIADFCAKVKKVVTK